MTFRMCWIISLDSERELVWRNALAAFVNRTMLWNVDRNVDTRLRFRRRGERANVHTFSLRLGDEM